MIRSAVIRHERLWGFLVLLVAVTLRIWDPAPVASLRLKALDLFQILGPSAKSKPIVTIVDLDEASLKEIGQWPWPRTTVAKLITRLKDAGVVAIGLDIIFVEPDRMSPKAFAEATDGIDVKLRSALMGLRDNDQVLAKAIRQIRVVLGQSGFEGAKETDQGMPPPKVPVAEIGADPRPWLFRYPSLIRNIPVLEKAALGFGMLTVNPEFDGVVRRVALASRVGDQIYPALALEMLRVATGQKTYGIKANEAGIKSFIVAGTDIPTNKNGQFWVRFKRHDPSRFVSAKDVLRGTAPLDRLRGKLVIIGTSAVGMRDIKPTPLENAIPSVEIHAMLIENIFSKEVLFRPNYAIGAEIIFAAIVSVLLIVFVPSWGALRSMLSGVVAMVILTGLVWFAFTEYGMLFDMTFPVWSTFAVFVFLASVNYVREETSKQQIRSAFGRYLAPEMVQRLADRPDQLVLGGETKDLTILFSDIRGFTTISENYSAEELTNLINRFLTPMSAIVLDHKGTIDKYIGDCIMAFWNAPLDDPEHAMNACRAALAMIARLDTFNAETEASDKAAGRKHQPIRVGVGINTGPCSVGNMGSEQRFSYSVLGDAVNLASRLEGETKNYGVEIIVGEETQKLVPEIATVELDVVTVKGKTKSSRIYGLIGDEKMASAPEFVELQARHRGIQESARLKDWKGLARLIAECREGPDYGLTRYYDLMSARVPPKKQGSKTA